MLRKLVINFLLAILTSSLFAQEGLLQRKVSVELTNADMITLFKAVEKKGRVHFSYNPDILPKEKNITIYVHKKTILDVLKPILDRNQLEVLERGKQLIIVPVRDKTVQLTGMVIHRVTRRGVKGVRITEARSLTSTKSDGSGYYTMEIPKDMDTVYMEFSHPGFNNERAIVSLAGDRYISSSLMPRPKPMEFIPVREISGEVASVENDIIVGALVNDEVIEASRYDTNGFKTGIQISLFPPLSTNKLGSGAAVNNLSLNLLIGYAEGLNGLELGGLLNVDRGETKGIQASGFANVVGGPMVGIQGAGFLNVVKSSIVGIQTAGFINSTGDNMVGLQGGGFANIHRGRIKGVQLAGFANYAKPGESDTTGSTHWGVQGAGFNNTLRGDLNGAQLAGFSNYLRGNGKGMQASGFVSVASGNFIGIQLAGFQNTTTKDLYGIQGAGFLNVTGGHVNGLQGAGFLNIAGKNVKGIQAAGFMNVADNIYGLQAASFLNRAKKVYGVQIGFINKADEVNGVSIGFLNMIKNGYKRWELARFGNQYVGLFYKTGTRWFYNIFNRGWYHGDIHGTGYGIGIAPIKNDNWTVNMEAIGIQLSENFQDLEGINLWTVGRLDLAGRIFWRLELFAGASYNLFLEDNGQTGELISDRTVIPGEATVRNYRLINTHEWISWQAGLRYGK